MDSVVRSNVDVVFLERGHALCEDGEDVAFFDGVVDDQICGGRRATTSVSRLARQGQGPTLPHIIGFGEVHPEGHAALVERAVCHLGGRRV